MNNRKSRHTALPIINRVVKTIRRYAMFAPRDRVLVGVSGGPDSVALLQILKTLASHDELDLAVAHLDHGLRPESAEREAAFVTRLAGALNLVCHVEHLRVVKASGSLEERMRRARYAGFNRLTEQHGYNKIALGHHTDDNAEAVLLHLMRGSGNRGLAGIPPVRDGRIVRPLIHIRRAEILDYLQMRNQDYVQDTSNDDLRFERNRIRHQLIPLLEENYNPNIVATLHRTADLCWEEEQWLQAHLAGQVDHLVASQTPDRLELHAHRLASVPLGLKRRLIRDALRRWHGNLRRLGFDHIETIIRMLSPDQVTKRISLPDLWQVERTQKHLCFTPDRRQATHKAAEPLDFHQVITTADQLPFKMDIPEAKGSLHLELAKKGHTPWVDLGNQTALFDLEQIEFPLSIRNFQPGDRLRPFGMQGSQKLKQLFNDRKIPRHYRGYIPLLVCNGQIIWVAGMRRGRMAAVSRATTRVLVARWLPAKLAP